MSEMQKLIALVEEMRAEIAAMKAQLERIEEATPLYVNEAETAWRLGVSEERWRRAKRVLEGQGLRKRDDLMGGRYWPAVKAFFDRRHGLNTPSGLSQPDGEENLDVL